MSGGGRLMPESARTCWKVPNTYSSINLTRYSTLSRHVWIHIEPSLYRHWDPRSCLFKHLRIWKRIKYLSSWHVCDKRVVTDANVDDLFLMAGLREHRPPEKKGISERKRFLFPDEIRTSGPRRASDPTEFSRRLSVLWSRTL